MPTPEDLYSHAPAIFLDRDGTLMEDVDYCSKPEDVNVFAGVPEVLSDLKQAGYLLIIITNQSGIGRGYFTENEFHAVQTELIRQIGEGVIDATFFCGDDPSESSERRKPSPTMIFEALKTYRIDMRRSFFIGDKDIDCQCGKRAGLRTILVRTGYGQDENTRFADIIEDDLVSAAKRILSR